MTTRLVILLLTFVATIPGLFAQNAQDDRVLFTVEGVPVTVGEFTYIYSKTNGDKANFSRASLEEYLDLYVRFKLKVQRAREMRLDTVPSLQEELAGYRRQLSDSYLIDRAIVDRLLEEGYAHLQQDVAFSHILFALNQDPLPADTLAAYQRADAVLKRIQQGAGFADMAAEHSDDRYTKERGGRVGYLTAPFPSGLHRLEYAAYSAPLNKAVGPIRTSVGYHLLLVADRRPARGEVEAAHILVRKDNHPGESARMLIDSIYAALQSGKPFDELARSVSEDTRSASNGGYIGFFGVNRYEAAFEDAAFGIAADGQYSRPVETTAGWHIIKRISLKPIQPFSVEKARLDGIIRKDPRFEEAKAGMLTRIRRESNFRENAQLLDGYITSLPDSFVTFRWKAPQQPSKETLFTLGKDYKVTLGDFTNYLGDQTRQRASLARQGTAQDAARNLYQQFINDQLLKYEEAQLEVKYPEFKALMREYEEGILLFEATKLEVWDRASQDSLGLERFFATATGKYSWLERGRITTYRVGMSYKDQVAGIQEFARTHTAEEVKAKFNTAEAVVVTSEEGLYEKGRNPITAKMLWKVGGMSLAEDNTRSRSVVFYKIEEIVPPGPKTLNEARGYVVADYQDQLERDWVDGLRRKFKVQINQKIFDSLVR